MLVHDFVAAFNEHRSATFAPTEALCVDKSISRWHGNGGSWIEIGLPHYVSLDRNPETGCEIKDASSGRSGVMVQIEIVKTNIGDSEVRTEQSLPHVQIYFLD